MYASQTRTNTKYTDFLRSYYPDPNKNVNVTETQTFSNNFVLTTTTNDTNLSNLSLNKSNNNSTAAREHSTFNITNNNANNNAVANHNSNQSLNPNQIGIENYSFNSLNQSQSDGTLPKTKFAELFSVDDSHALRLKLLKDTSEIHGGIVKVFSDSDIVRLHHKIQESFNFSQSPVKHPNSSNSATSKLKRSQSADSSASGSVRPHSSDGTHKTLEVKVDVESENKNIAEDGYLKTHETVQVTENQELRGSRSTAGTRTGTTGTGIALLEQDLQKLHEETLQILSGKREDDNHLPPNHGHGPTFFNHVSYQEILKAEHIALRRELLNNIREISRATFFEDFYTGKSRTDDKHSRDRHLDDGNGDGDEIEDRQTNNRHKRVDSNRHRHHVNDLEIESALHNFSFHPGRNSNTTADPTDRIDQWIQNSQEHLNNLPINALHNEHKPENDNHKNRATGTSSDNNNFETQIESQTPSLHASLFHDSIWHENEDLPFDNFDNEDELGMIAPAANNNSLSLPALTKREKEKERLLDNSIADSDDPSNNGVKKKPFVIQNNIVINNFDTDDKVNESNRSRNRNQKHLQHANSQKNLVTETEILKNQSKSRKSVDYVNFEDNEHGYNEVNHLELGGSFPSVHALPQSSNKTGDNGEANFGFGSDNHSPEVKAGAEFSEVDFENSDVISFKHSRISKIASASATSAPTFNNFDSNSLRRSQSTASYDNNYDSLNLRINRDRVPPALLPVIPQPANERFPARIYEPRYKYEKIKFRKENKLTSTLLPSLKSGVQLTIDSSIGPPLAFTDSRNIVHSIMKPTTHNILNTKMNQVINPYNNTIIGLNNIHNHFSKYTDPPKNTIKNPHHHDDHVRIIQAELLQLQPPSYIKNPKKGTRVPGVIRRHNMDQWVAKKVWFYVNGDEHIPKFEYRFKPKRDVKNMDGLCDILSNRLKLVNGVRYIFTIDGELVDKLEDLRHEHYYVASSTKKFKVIDRMNFESILKPDFQKSFKTKTISSSFPTAFN